EGRQAVIVDALRSPIGRAFRGSLVGLRPDDMSAQVVTALLGRHPAIGPADVDDVIWGCASPAGEQGYNLARVVSVLSGLKGTPGTTVNRYCASSLQAARMAAHAIAAGEGDIFVAGGVESVSRFTQGCADEMPGTHNPRFAAAEQRSARRAAEGSGNWEPPEGLPDIYIAMGQTAENVRQLCGVTREAMDRFAQRSQQRAVESQDNGFFEAEIVPLCLPDGAVIGRDEGPRRGTDLAAMAHLAPAFRSDGELTAGNSCPLNDGAAALLVMSAERAAQLGLRARARIVASAVSALDPEIMGLGPVESCRRVLARAGMTMDDVDLVEINEAFAAQVIPCAEQLGIDEGRLNVHGGAIALGHPFGMTGARIMTTLLHGLEVGDGSIGLETMCVGGGQGMAMVIERQG
ncbi:MAG TPA: acetyl-CoA C-acetyltransferase, partial [Acidimicrobiales bacterium]|nr:acetyl-CoA C-acetyltransferase [Acidimicrobiales bacterium]